MRGIRCYQTEDDLHGWEAHACSLDRKSAWSLFSICLCVSWEATTKTGKERSNSLAGHSSLKRLLPKKKKRSTRVKVHWSKTLDEKEAEDLWNLLLGLLNIQNPCRTPDDYQ